MRVKRWPAPAMAGSLAGYDAGRGRVEQFRRIPPVAFARRQTHAYVIRQIPEGDGRLPAGNLCPRVVPYASRRDSSSRMTRVTGMRRGAEW
ncbi:hypothetical protein C0216_32350 (plasmid) [Streptomyces globosus]|uniref:Uncharacterized protein n=1 Tax=Streptomyces globosus TaxID=68209 RepID=A0A344UBA9_9ACTN|nr:hypothetical protein C0216_32350 [Streptomyces globosus]